MIWLMALPLAFGGAILAMFLGHLITGRTPADKLAVAGTFGATCIIGIGLLMFINVTLLDLGDPKFRHFRFAYTMSLYWPVWVGMSSVLCSGGVLTLLLAPRAHVRRFFLASFGITMMAVEIAFFVEFRILPWVFVQSALAVGLARAAHVDRQRLDVGPPLPDRDGRITSG